ncbi:MAG: sigma-70 family RNA polymerase sigma factor [Victivallales bacterium]|nr:sigma-70 family RNA polymerase sigma factor [Victivallales bacterium]
MAFTTRRSLLRGVHENTPAAWEKFQAFYTPLITLCGQDYGLNAEEIKDLRQNVLLAVFKHDLTGKFNPNIAHFRTLLRTVIQRKAIDILRQRLGCFKKLSNEIPDDNQTLEAQWKEEWRQFLLKIANEELREIISNDHYMAFDLYFTQKRPVAEVCEVLGMTQNQVYTIRSRVFKQLQDIIQRLESEVDE